LKYERDNQRLDRANSFHGEMFFIDASSLFFVEARVFALSFFPDFLFFPFPEEGSF
jgi:hypothetical protein